MTPGAVSPETQTPVVRGGGILGFLNSYPNPLTHFSTKASTPHSVTPSEASIPAKDTSGGFVDTTGVAQKLTEMATRKAYPLSMVVVVALIAFLIGSLLRSLLSPADFVYLVTDVKGAEEMESGWREIKRLVEFKYIVGGWDFQIAVVRRH
jgi:hypothetical protein